MCSVFSFLHVSMGNFETDSNLQKKIYFLNSSWPWLPVITSTFLCTDFHQQLNNWSSALEGNDPEWEIVCGPLTLNWHLNKLQCALIVEDSNPKQEIVSSFDNNLSRGLCQATCNNVPIIWLSTPSCLDWGSHTHSNPKQEIVSSYDNNLSRGLCHTTCCSTSSYVTFDLKLTFEQITCS